MATQNSLPSSVDPLSDLLTATELRIWRSHPATTKVLRFLKRWRERVVNEMAEGSSIHEGSCERTAMITVEYSAKAVLLDEIINLEAKDVADFYGLATPQDHPGESQ
jgi:hypothetical protein